ncbi:MAG: PAS domain-containing protein [Terracidiphilus sp.]
MQNATDSILQTKRAEAHTDPILDSINEGVFSVDHPWRITAFNRAAERITGLRRQGALGRQCPDVFRASIREGDCALRRTLSSGKPVAGATANSIRPRSQTQGLRTIRQPPGRTQPRQDVMHSAMVSSLPFFGILLPERI